MRSPGCSWQGLTPPTVVISGGTATRSASEALVASAQSMTTMAVAILVRLAIWRFSFCPLAAKT